MDNTISSNGSVSRTPVTDSGSSMSSSSSSGSSSPGVSLGASSSDVINERSLADRTVAINSDSLVEAIQTGNRELVETLIAHRLDINALDRFRRAPLIEAIKKRDFDTVELLINAGADVNVRDGSGQTPIFPAIYNENINLIATLIGRGADIVIQDNNGYDPLSCALSFSFYEGGSIESAIQLLESIDLENDRHVESIRSSMYRLVFCNDTLSKLIDMCLEDRKNILAVCVDDQQNCILLAAGMEVGANRLEYIINHPKLAHASGVFNIPVKDGHNLFGSIIFDERLTQNEKIDLIEMLLQSNMFNELPADAQTEHIKFLTDNITQAYREHGFDRYGELAVNFNATLDRLGYAADQFPRIPIAG